ncbi:flagellar hook-length control protein FliK [Arthrobacter sp. V4I6]|uniref:flagellar hook-length control protein FliK n=1 Tax=unclassified Arthrobacter TaxID=235627 RepID=UPI002788C8F9|nr:MULTISPECIES: flagellar hook-length control protein FliK [unclassified Arthrobacter]MDQ0822684.1 flagellar hook-length control protein FliK [Arthrobacter sp. V1I7]MDQ0852312.1 flagellar hook-length control protein FliK [Arthrobacter sp. V4I6]
MITTASAEPAAPAASPAPAASAAVQPAAPPESTVPGSGPTPAAKGAPFVEVAAHLGMPTSADGSAPAQTQPQAAAAFSLPAVPGAVTRQQQAAAAQPVAVTQQASASQAGAINTAAVPGILPAVRASAPPAATVAGATPATPAVPAGTTEAVPGVAHQQTTGVDLSQTPAVDPAGSTPPVSRAAAIPAAASADALTAAGTVATQPVSAPVQFSASATPAAPQPPSPAYPAPTLQPQLARPLFTLAGAPDGQHTMTLQVTPEDLGPLTVRAQIDAAGVRIELFAPGEVGREAIRGILPELRKELADSGFGASLDVSDRSGPGGSSQDGAGRDGAGRDAQDGGRGSRNGADPGGGNAPDEQRSGHRWDALADEAAVRTARTLNRPRTTLDILV